MFDCRTSMGKEVAAMDNNINDMDEFESDSEEENDAFIYY